MRDGLQGWFIIDADWTTAQQTQLTHTNPQINRLQASLFIHSISSLQLDPSDWCAVFPEA